MGTIALAVQNTVHLTPGVWNLTFAHGNRISISNLGTGDIWVRFDGQAAAVDNPHSLHLPTDASVTNVLFHQRISIAADADADVAIWCS